MNPKKNTATANPEIADLAVPTVENERELIEREVASTQEFFDQPRFDEITRLYSARQVVAQRGTIDKDYTVARDAATAFYARLREGFEARTSITTFGPYTPGQAVSLSRPSSLRVAPSTVPVR